MGSSLGSTNSIDKRNLPKLSVWNGDHNLPSISIDLVISNFGDVVFSIREVHVHIFEERVDWKLLVIQGDLYGRKQACHIVDSLIHQAYYILVELLHAETGELRIECHYCIVLPWVVFNLCLPVACHVLPPSHSELFTVLAVPALDNKLMREDVG